MKDVSPQRRGRLLDDDEIVVRVNQKAREAVGWYDSRLSRERERVMQYYNSQLPKRINVGSSSYVSTDVYDSVEGCKSMLLEVFAGGDEIARFDPDADMGVQDCEAATKYASYIIFQQNPGYQIFNDVIHNGLTARLGPVKVYWDECIEEEERTFQGLTLDAVHALKDQDQVDTLEADLNPQTGLYDGSLILRVDKSQVRIDQLPPEEFLVAPRMVSLEKKHVAYLGHRTLKTKPELLDMGFDKQKVANVHYDDAHGLDLSPEVLARNAPVETLQAYNNPIQPELEQVMLYESYATMVIDKSKGARLYKIFHASDILFEYEEVDRHPFLCYVPLPVPHLVFGNNFAMRVAPFQNARTVLVRAVLDHASMTVNPRWQVVNGGLMNPREMLDNRMGGLVNVRRPDSVAALQVPNLNPFVFEVLQLLEENNEKSTGISSLSQGLNKDAVSKQNSRGLINDLVNLSSQRQKIAARNFAYNFFVPLMFEVIRLAILHEKKPKVIEVAGSPINIDASKWTERRTATVSMHLGYGEKDEMVQKLKGLYESLAQDPAIQTMFTTQNRYNLITDASKIGGISQIARYITPPSQVQPPQPDPIKMAEVQAKTKLADAAMLTATSNADKNQRLAAYEDGKLQLDGQKLQLDAVEKDRDHDRRDLETAARVDVAHRQMALEEQMRPQEAQLKAVVSPNP